MGHRNPFTWTSRSAPELVGQEHIGPVSGYAKQPGSRRNRRALFATQRAKPLDLTVVDCQQVFSSPVEQHEFRRPLRPSVVRTGDDVRHLGPRDISPTREANTPFADHGFRYPRHHGQCRVRRSEGQVLPLTSLRELRGSKQQPADRENAREPTDRTFRPVPPDNLLRGRTVRFRGLLIGCQSVGNHEVSMTRRDVCSFHPSIGSEPHNSATRGSSTSHAVNAANECVRSRSARGRAGCERTARPQKSASRHTRRVRQAERAQQSDDSSLGWFRRRPANLWLRFAIPGLVLFGGGFVLRFLFRRDEGDLYLYRGVAALALVSLIVGLI